MTLHSGGCAQVYIVEVLKLVQACAKQLSDPWRHDQGLVLLFNLIWTLILAKTNDSIVNYDNVVPVHDLKPHHLASS